MKGRHVSKKTQRRLINPVKDYSKMSISQLMKLAENGDEKAKRTLRTVCGSF